MTGEEYEQESELEAEEAVAAPGQPGDAPLAENELAALREELEQARNEAVENRDKYLRAAAEVENTRRRADNDVANARKFAVEGFAGELLNVRDSLELARTVEISAEDTAAMEKMKEGLDLTLKQMDSVFARFQVEEVSPEPGDKLDPERHQAMTTQESSDVPPNHILAVVQKGYLIHDRLLRPAMVIVARAVEAEKADTAAGEA